MLPTRAGTLRRRRHARWARLALLVLLPLLLVACPTQERVQAGTARLHVSALGSGRLEVNGSFRTLPYAATLPHGTEVALRAEADAGHAFDRWSGGATGRTNPLTLILTGDQDVVAVFVADPEPAPVTLGVATDGDGSGRVTSIPVGIDCGATCTATFAPGTLLTLTATPDADSTVAALANCDTHTDTTCTIALDADRTVTVSFGQEAAPPPNDDAEGAPAWQIAPARLDLTADVASTTPRTVVLRNDGDAEGTFALVSDRTWLTADPASGTLASGADLTLDLLVGCPAAGREVATLTVDGGDASARLTVDRTCLEPSATQLTIDRFYVNQAVPAQDTLPGARSVPLVADRDGLVRVFVTTAEPGTSAASVTLAYRCGGAGTVSEVALTGPSQVPTATVEGDRATVYERRLDADEVCANLQVAVTAAATGPQGGRAEARWPATGFAALTTTTPPATSFVLVPVALNGGAAPSIPDPSAYLADVERMFPFGEGTIASVTVGASLAFAGDLTQGAAWGSLLEAVTSIANADPQDRHHIGVVTPPYSGGIAGIAWVGFGSPSYKAAVVWSRSGFASVTAHELGHNWGRRHAPCGGAGGPDAGYPYPGGSIGVWGFDLAGDALKDPAGYADLMGYCDPSWVSDYTYAGIAAFRTQYGFSVRAASAPVPGVLLTGVVDHDTGNLTLDPVFALDARPEPVPPGPYLAVGVAADGTEAFRVPFGTLEVSRHEIELFRVFVPWPGAAAPALAALRIERDGVVLVERVAGVRPSAVPIVASERTTDGRVRLSWAAGAFPWVRVSDADDGTLLGVGRGGELLVAPVGPRLRVRLGDGLNTVAVDVAY